MLISLSNVSNLLQNGQFPVFNIFLAAIIVTIAMVKVELIPDFYTWVIVLKTNKKRLMKNNFDF